MSVSSFSRRDFVAACLGVGAGALLPFRVARAAPPAETWQGTHPTPRPGIDASRVPTAGELRDAKRSIAVFDEVREIPQIIDGIRCHCGCAKNPDHYSLLSCFETRDAMAKDCSACRMQASYVYRLHNEGKSLDEIRAAVDERFR